MNFRRARRDPARVDVTPLIDIIFQLVLFFMVSTTFIATPGIEVELPRSSSETVRTDDDALDIWMTEGGEIYVAERPVDWEGLVARVERAAAEDPSVTVLIKADQGLDHGRVVAVMDLVRSRGLRRLAISTDPQGPASKSVEDP